jgi:hypothetical protein
LIDAEIAHGKATGGESKLLRPFLAEFRGLTGTAKARAVCAAVPDAKRLSDLNGNVAPLLAAMQRASAEAKPTALGWIGEDHVRGSFDCGYGIVRDRFWYKRVAVMDRGIPLVVEAAVAETERPGGILTAVNFSPTFAEPIGDVYLVNDHVEGYGIGGFLRTCEVRADVTTTAFVHIVHPAPTFFDRGKSRLQVSDVLRDAVLQALWHCGKTFWAEGEQRRKDAAAAERRRNAEVKAWQSNTPKPSTVTEAAFTVMEEAWSQATNDGADIVAAKTLFYVARPLMQKLTDRPITATYFTQHLLPLYERERRPLPGLYYEPRGTLYEPHGGEAVPLGTREVERYSIPAWTYDKLLFVEKQGRWPELKRSVIGERFDMAIISGAGFATVAARTLLERAEADCTIFVLHDADPNGYGIADTVARETARMPDHRVEVIDLGLTLDTALALGLGTETFSRKSALPARLDLGETEQRMWKSDQKASKNRPVTCERVELNAMTYQQLIAYIEDGLAKAGVTAKVVPDAATIAAVVRDHIRSSVSLRLKDAMENLVDLEALGDKLAATIEADPEQTTPESIRTWIEPNRVTSWRAAAGTCGSLAARRALDDDAIDRAVRAAIAEALR